MISVGPVDVSTGATCEATTLVGVNTASAASTRPGELERTRVRTFAGKTWGSEEVPRSSLGRPIMASEAGGLAGEARTLSITMDGVGREADDAVDIFGGGDPRFGPSIGGTGEPGLVMEWPLEGPATLTAGEAIFEGPPRMVEVALMTSGLEAGF